MKQLDVTQLAAWMADPGRPQPLLIDVREPWEVELCSIDGALHIPMHTIPLRAGELPAERDLVIVCHHGGRSMQVAYFFERQGFASVHNLAGGIDAWASIVAPGMRRY